VRIHGSGFFLKIYFRAHRERERKRETPADFTLSVEPNVRPSLTSLRS